MYCIKQVIEPDLVEFAFYLFTYQDIFEVEFVPNSMNSEVRMIDRIFPTYATFGFVIVCICKLSNIFITTKNPKGMIT